MRKANITYEPQGLTGFIVTLSFDEDSSLTLSGQADGPDPTIAGTSQFTRNPALVDNLWAYATQENFARRTMWRSQDERKGHAECARRHGDLSRYIAELIQVGIDSKADRLEWCSGCLGFQWHRRVADKTLIPWAFLCQKCGSPTSVCFAPQCKNMAVRRPGGKRLPRYCAEHRHEIPSFAKLSQSIKSLDGYEDWLSFDKHNFASTTRITTAGTVGAAILFSGAWIAAPAIGGAIGVTALGGSLTGAAATSHGLAMLGLGSLASGGFGMAGGTVAIAVVGGGLGGVVGGRAASAYTSDDKSFKIERLQEGTGPPVVLASGFLTQGDNGWGSWESLIRERYPNSPVYRVHWGSKELKSIVVAGGSTTSKVFLNQVVKTAAQLASKASAKAVSTVGYPLLAADVIANPWNVARKRADKTGDALADILYRTETDKFILVGHSLGARVMAATASVLGTRSGLPRLESVHLLGAAIGADRVWHTLNASVTDRVWNYHSSNDKILQLGYRVAQGGQKAAGVVGIKSTLRNIKNVDLSKSVLGHDGYFTAAKLR